jgi:hypothetical protein
VIGGYHIIPLLPIARRRAFVAHTQGRPSSLR